MTIGQDRTEYRRLALLLAHAVGRLAFELESRRALAEVRASWPCLGLLADQDASNLVGPYPAARWRLHPDLYTGPIARPYSPLTPRQSDAARRPAIRAAMGVATVDQRPPVALATAALWSERAGL